MDVLKNLRIFKIFERSSNELRMNFENFKATSNQKKKFPNPFEVGFF